MHLTALLQLTAVGILSHNLSGYPRIWAFLLIGAMIAGYIVGGRKMRGGP